MWIEYNPNPAKNRTEDCAIRALAKALDTDWDGAFALVAAEAFKQKQTCHSNAVSWAILREHGFQKSPPPHTCPDCFTVEDFCNLNPEGLFVVYSEGHVATVEDGAVWDTWDSTGKVPLYVWYKGKLPRYKEDA